MDIIIDKVRIIYYWIESSENDFKTMNDLYQTKNNSWALFMGHLVIEKLLKALFIKQKDEYPPLIHDLRCLCEKADLKLDNSRIMILDSVSRFNINARYDDYKQSFYKLRNDGFTTEWIDKINECMLWIKLML